MNATLRVKLGNMLIEVPIYRDEASTMAIVDQINDRLKAIEDKASVIDSQRFALLAAYIFAVETREHAAELEEMASVFEELDAELDRVLRDFASD